MRFSEYRLQKALLHREFIPFYQPIVSRETKRIVGCEVLARWLMPEQGLINAANFIEPIEKFHLTDALTRILTEEVLTEIPEFRSDSFRADEFILTFNISLSMLLQAVLREHLITFSRQLKRAGITAVFELTEREDIQQTPHILPVLHELVGAGLQFAVDDFGTGFASEELAVACRAAYIKIDGSYAADPGSSTATRFIKQTLNLSRRLNARVIAEGVENRIQETWLSDLNIDFLQGFRYGKPMPAGIFSYWLTKQRFPGMPVAS